MRPERDFAASAARSELDGHRLVGHRLDRFLLGGQALLAGADHPEGARAELGIRRGSEGRGSSPSRAARPRTGSSRPRRRATRRCCCGGRSPWRSPRGSWPRPSSSRRGLSEDARCSARSCARCPSRTSISGSHPSRSRARAMSGWRTCGSSTGQRLEHDLRARLGQLDDQLRHLEQRHLVRVADVHRLVHLGLGEQHQAADQVVDVTEAARLSPSPNTVTGRSASAWLMKAGIARPSFGRMRGP